ncbi:MAG: MFS transporter [Anaerolineaceae bacterium]|nr:MFS transporter [Anaerolineaceae bacterium]
MLKRFSALKQDYPRQFWLIFWGQLISVSGMTLVWPFLTIYMREHLQLPLATITSLIGLEAIMTVIATLTVGPIMDRIGRKWIMVASLGINGVVFFLMGFANSLTIFAILMVIRGFFGPLFRVGTNTMVADLIPKERQIDAYSLIRISSNVGFAFGPAVGGFIAASSFNLSLNISAIFLVVMTFFTAVLLKETLPALRPIPTFTGDKAGTGYGKILKDKSFVIFLSGDTLVKMGMIMMFVLLSVYVKENFGIPENQYGFLMTVNALIGGFLQFPATMITRKYSPSLMLALGAVFYALGLGSVAFGNSFFHFLISMVILSIGEIILMPTAMTLVARIAPMDMRARYMSLYSLTMGAAKGVGPVIGGLLNDNISPAAIWYGGFIMAMMSMSVFLMLHRRQVHLKVQEAIP